MSTEQSPLVRFYHALQEQLHTVIDEGKESLPTLQQLVEESKEKGSELSELTREEIDAVSRYLQRDLEAAGSFLAETGEDLGRWFHMEETLVEDRLKELLGKMADPTRIALDKLSAEARAAQPYHQGEVIGMGKLECGTCGETLQFDETAVIPACPKCGATEFRRVE